MNKYKCKNCFWQGTEDELSKELVESCMGNDEIEVCPNCGSMDIIVMHDLS
jgi:NAD-dependent SIR2 family protein deacetylase